MRAIPIGLLIGLTVVFLILFFNTPKSQRFTKQEKILQRTAATEHDLGWLPHSDPDVHRVCQHCPKEIVR